MSRTPLLNQAAEIASAYFERRDSSPVFPNITPERLRKAFGAGTPVPEKGQAAEQVIAELARTAEPGLVAHTGPRYFGFVIGGSLPVATAADWLTSAWDQNAGLYVTSPANSVVEEVAAGWLLELLGLPSTASLGFTTGCSMANFTALAAAEGLQYGVPGEGPDSSQIFYNLDLFKEAGVTTDPQAIAKWTWQDFTDAAKALTKMDGDQVKQSGFMVPKPDASTLSVWATI
jgi:hypothetical protein